MKVQINTFNELIDFIETSNLSLEQYATIISNSLSLFIDTKKLTKQNLITKLKDYWSKYKNQLEKPLFLN
jgi:hypothetical protein